MEYTIRFTPSLRNSDGVKNVRLSDMPRIADWFMKMATEVTTTEVIDQVQIIRVHESKHRIYIDIKFDNTLTKFMIVHFINLISDPDPECKHPLIIDQKEYFVSRVDYAKIYDESDNDFVKLGPWMI